MKFNLLSAKETYISLAHILMTWVLPLIRRVWKDVPIFNATSDVAAPFKGSSQHSKWIKISKKKKKKKKKWQLSSVALALIINKIKSQEYRFQKFLHNSDAKEIIVHWIEDGSTQCLRKTRCRFVSKRYATPTWFVFTSLWLPNQKIIQHTKC